MKESSSKIKIDRGEVRHDLHNFASQDNGIVIGSPGVGKTYLLKELLRHLKSEDIPHLLLPIDLLGDSNPKEWPDGFSFQGNLIDALKSVPISDKKGILFFDGFDAARDDGKRKNFLILIQRAIQELDNWNVIVTVRTYDAKKSQDLLDLFGSKDNSVQTPYHVEDILCRHFNIPFLEKYEILLALEQIKCPIQVYENGSIEFQQDILSKPFNLWLLEKILQMPGKDPDFSQVYSEIQLLQEYLDRRIKDRDKKHILDGIAREMVKKRTLSVKEFDIYEDLELDKPVRMAAFENLLSDDILTVDSTTKQNITFSHNILFDYAISVLLIEDKPDQLERFITEDPSRPLFLRPSLTYYFTRLWYYKRDNFWAAFWHILPKDQSVHLRLVARLIPPSVIANEARNKTDLEPLMQKLQNRKPISEEAIIRLMQSLQNLHIKRELPWIHFHDQVSQHLHDNFAWDLANLTSDILEKTTDSNVIDACGRVARRLLKWVWQERETNEDDWCNRFGGRWAVPLVANTYHKNVEESRALLEKVLQLMQKENFPIEFLAGLTDNVDKIWDRDPEFVSSIYRNVFAHQFTSEGETQRGGPVFGITTYRSQDFRMCQYRLVKHFPKFLQKKTLQATEAVIQSLNSFICSEHILQYPTEGVTSDDLKEPFEFHGKTAYFVKDNSYIWDAQNSSDEPIELADKLFEFIEELTVSKESLLLLDSLLDIFRDQVLVAFFWKRLLKTASKFPKIFAPRLFELCLAKPIQLSSETSYELGLFLKNAVLEFKTDDKLRQIEESILLLPREAKDEEDPEILKRLRNRLLVQIPENLLSTDEGRKVREKMEQDNDVPVNRPPFSIRIGSETVTQEKWLQDRGVDTTMPENQELQNYLPPLDKFGTEWLNNNPANDVIESIFPTLQQVYNTLKTGTNADEKVIDMLWGNLTDCVAIMSRVANVHESSLFTFCRKVLLDAATHKLPKPNPERDEDLNFSTYSRNPRDQASRGLLKLITRQPDLEILKAIKTLANDEVPSVRMVTSLELFRVYDTYPKEFWSIMYYRAKHEKHPVVQASLYFALNYVVGIEKENENKTTTVMDKLLKHTPSPERKIGTSDPFISLLMYLVIERENSWAIDFIKNTYSNDPIQHSSLLTRIVRRTMENYVISEQLESEGDHEIVKRAINCVSEVITVSSKKIKELCLSINENITEENQQKLQNAYGVIDQVISSLYYTFAHERGKSENQTETISDGLRLLFL